jgi:hypothetical protein
MAETFLGLPPKDRLAALGVAATTSGRPQHLLKKDVWVVWALAALLESRFASHLAFKGGTSLSKAYKAIRRFSEDLEQIGAPAEAIAQDDSIIIKYDAIALGSGYVAPEVKLEFGARSTGEPSAEMPVACDAAEYLPDLIFPSASPLVMRIERTFWEKATAIHVFCRQRRLRGERFARHWHDLTRIDEAGYAENAMLDDGEPFDTVIERCRIIQEQANATTRVDAD